MECGVDIEKIEASHNMMGIANRFFSLPEYNAMLLSQNPKEAFCRLWTLRESYVKMRGTGFDIGLSTLRCDFHRGVCSIYQDEILQTDAFFLNPAIFMAIALGMYYGGGHARNQPDRNLNVRPRAAAFRTAFLL